VHQHGPPAAVHHDIGGRAVVVLVGTIVHVPGTTTAPTNTPTADAKITKPSATATTPGHPTIGIRSDGQHEVAELV
jgi:hypothetical protein